MGFYRRHIHNKAHHNTPRSAPLLFVRDADLARFGTAYHQRPSLPCRLCATPFALQYLGMVEKSKHENSSMEDSS